MSRFVLGVSASPRPIGNTDALVRHALAGAAAGGARTEFVRLYDRRIGDCDGCQSCRPDGRCHQRDDMAALLGQLREADLLVFGSPIWANQATAAMKRMLERTLPLMAPDYLPRIDLPTVLVLTQAHDADPGLDAYLEILSVSLGRTGMRVKSIHREMAMWEPGAAAGRAESLARLDTRVREALARGD